MNMNLECPDCDAVCNIKHDMDEEIYRISFCPYCGYEVDEDDIDIMEYKK